MISRPRKSTRTDPHVPDTPLFRSQATVARDATVRAKIPALAHLADGIGDPQVRNRGTISGSIANNDPAADYPAGLFGLGATVHTSKRALSADAFFTGLFEPALAED